MKTPRTSFRLAWLGLLSLVAIMGLGGYAFQSGGALQLLSGPLPEPLGDVPAFTLRDHRSQDVTSSDWLGSIVVVNFIYSRCAEACPLSTAHMLKLQTVYAQEARVRLVSISVDPDYDTPEVLASYAERLGVRSTRWAFLTGEKEQIYRLAKEGFRLGVLDPNDLDTTSRLQRLIDMVTPAVALAHDGTQDGHQPIQHSARLVVVDGQGRIRQYYDSRDADVLQRVERDVNLLLR